MDTTRIDRSRNTGWVALVTLALALAALLIALLATGTGAHESHPAGHGAHGATDGSDGAVDGPEGFEVEPLARGAFTDHVAAKFRLRYEAPGQPRGTIVRNLHDAGEVVVAKVTFEPGGTSGWHTHPGPAIVNVIEGDLDVTNASDCVTRDYEAGDAWLDPGQGNVHNATNPSAKKRTVAYVTFFGVPEGEPATQHVAPVDC
jgi:quercetin dioxygenase-like cupin family protein